MRDSGNLETNVSATANSSGMNEDETLVRSRAELDILLANIESAIKVRQRSDFFSWVQGVFQGLIRHEVLISALAGSTERSYRVECTSSIPIGDELLIRLSRPPAAFLSRLVSEWEIRGRQPLVVDPRLPPFEHDTLVRATMNELGSDAMLAHGILDIEGATAILFCFTRIGERLQPAHSRALALITPYLYTAWTRVRAGEHGTQSANSSVPRLILTARQIEILNWVEQGKSNGEIGQILNISQLTVKNHMQKILRRLGVQNRAQAVATGMMMNLTRRVVSNRSAEE